MNNVHFDLESDDKVAIQTLTLFDGSVAKQDTEHIHFGVVGNLRVREISIRQRRSPRGHGSQAA